MNILLGEFDLEELLLVYSTRPAVSFFFYSFNIIMNWILLNVRSAPG